MSEFEYMALLPGSRIGSYEIVAPLGAGGMGEVYRARDAKLGREVAIKVLPPAFAQDADSLARLEREAKLLASLSHPNILVVHDVGTRRDAPYIVTELLEGESLRERLGGGALPVRKAVETAVQIAQGLAAAHERGIVHRDLKPGNVFITKDGHVKILDFGLAKLVAPGSMDELSRAATAKEATQAGTVLGTIGYMSPEQVRGENLDHRSDIFNLGLMLHEILAGKRAFQGDTSVETMTAILKQGAPELPEAIPAPVRQIVARCLEKQPANRFQSAKDLAFALGQAVPSGVAQQSRGAARRSRLPLQLAAGLALIAAAFIASHWLWRERPPAPLNGLLLSNNAWFPRVSPDGHTLAYTAIVGDALELGIMKPESGDRAVLTHGNGKGYIQAKCWSQDGTRIYFERVTDIPRGIYSIAVLGSEERLILEDAGSPGALPDGSLLVIRFNSRGRQQLYRFWPDTGNIRDYPLDLGAAYYSYTPYCILPDGRQAIVYGALLKGVQETNTGLYLVNIDSGSVRPFVEDMPGAPQLWAMAPTRDGRSILTATRAGNLTRISAIPVSGDHTPITILSLTGNIRGMDTGPDAGIYLDQIERPAELLQFRQAGGRTEKIAELTLPTMMNYFAVLPDGRAVAPEVTGGHYRLMIYQPGKDPVPLVNTAEETTAPLAAAGDKMAFVMPPGALATASVASGRITRKIPFEKGEITGLDLTPDGATLYCAAGGFVWALPTAGGEPRKIRAGHSVAIDPSGQMLLVNVLDTAGPQLIRVPLNGGPEQPVPGSTGLRPAGPLLAGSLARDGRIAMPGSSSFWWNPAAVFDVATGQARQLSLDYVTDFHSLTWTPDGQIMGLGFLLRSKIWKFQPESAQISN